MTIEASAKLTGRVAKGSAWLPWLRSARRFSAGAAIVVVATIAADKAPAIEISPEIAELYTSVSIHPPSAGSMTVCYGFVCRRRMTLDFTLDDRKALAKILAAGKASPAAERIAVQKAVVWFDLRVGPIIGTDKRVAYADFRYFDNKHNFDCWDTTRNTASLLLILQEWGFLKHHVVGTPRYRGNPLLLQTPHNTAVLVDRAARSDWVVDLWPRKYAEMPDVMPVEQWLREN